MQGNKQVTRAAVEFYGPERAKFLGELVMFGLGCMPPLAAHRLSSVVVVALGIDTNRVAQVLSLAHLHT